jgi:hypothetical protein
LAVAAAALRSEALERQKFFGGGLAAGGASPTRHSFADSDASAEGEDDDDEEADDDADAEALVAG